jgi:hypothetical protein
VLIDGELENPTLAQMSAIAPHLNPDALQDMVNAAEQGLTVRFALPPVLLQGLYQQAKIYTGKGVIGVTLGLPQSISAPTEIKYQEEALTYAQQHWGDHLIQRHWLEVGEVSIFDTVSLTDNHPTYMYTVGWTLDRRWDDVRNDRSQPLWQAWDKALLLVTMNGVEIAEITATGNGHSYYRNCAYCGGGLSSHRCTGCGRQYRDDGISYCWDAPLPPKIVKLLRDAGHKFDLDPERLWK